MGKQFKGKEMRHVRRPCVALTWTIIMSSTDDDYDKLSTAEREARDQADREREAAEQAGIYLYCRNTNVGVAQPSFTLPQHYRTHGSSSSLK